MRVANTTFMSEELANMKSELKLRQQQVVQIEEEIRLLSLTEKATKAPSLKERFPENSIVRLTGKNEKHYLRRKKARVIGHTTCYVRLEWKNGKKKETFLRAPENITIVKHVEQKKEGAGSKGASQRYSR